MEKRPIKYFVKENLNNETFIELVDKMKSTSPVIARMCIKGWGNGYAILPPGHPLYGVDLAHIDICVHEAITFAHFSKDMCWPEVAEDIDGYVIGFDTSHVDDTADNCTEEYVRKKAKELAEILDTMW